MATKSLETVSRALYVTSAYKYPRSSLGDDVLTPSSTQESSLIQFRQWNSLSEKALSGGGGVQPVHSTRGSIWWNWVPNRWEIDVQRWEINCSPLMKGKHNGTTKQANQCETRALVQVADVVSLRAIASDYLEEQLTTVRCVHLPEGGRDPTMSTWMWSNCPLGMLSFSSRALVSAWILDYWQVIHCLTFGIHWVRCLWPGKVINWPPSKK